MKFIVEPCGALGGAVEIAGSKNAVLPVLAASVLTERGAVLQNVPDLSDVDAMLALLASLGARARREGDALFLDASDVNSLGASYELVGKLRASFLIMGPLLARFGRVKLPLPGGCAIGSRPVDLHLKGLSALGADIEHSHGFVTAHAKRLRGAKIYLDFPSVGATENVMMAAVLAEGQTILENCANEPEIVDLANFLNTIGAKVRGAGTDTIKIEGVQRLTVENPRHSIIPDRIEAGTFMVAAALTRGDVTVTNITPDHVKPVTAKLKEVNVRVEERDDSVRVFCDSEIIASDLKTLPYPGFPTDMQAQFMSLLATATGTSVITETVFENRFMQVGELKRMGADIKIESRSAIIEGVQKLTGAQVAASDLRAGAALVLAALRAEGPSEISAIHHIDRGYDRFDTRLNKLGANIRRVDE